MEYELINGDGKRKTMTPFKIKDRKSYSVDLWDGQDNRQKGLKSMTFEFKHPNYYKKIKRKLDK